MSAPDRKALLDHGHPMLSIRRQCSVLGLARSGIYRPVRIANDDELAITRRLDELFLAWPFFGSRRMTVMLRAEGWVINRKRVRRLMRVMGSWPSARSRTPRGRRRGTRSTRTCCATW
jgi:putative transposase